MFVPSSRAAWITALTILLSAAPMCGDGGAQAGDDRPTAAATDALQVMADLALIDGTCRAIVVDFGAGFRFAATQGIPATAILPGGSRRAEFEAVLQSRQGSFGRDELCGQMAQNYAEALPGSVMPGYYRQTDGKP